MGTATKGQFIQEFGDAQWCSPKDNGEETCRFYKKTATKWIGEPKDREHYEAYDEVIADFDSKGVLKAIKTKAQR